MPRAAANAMNRIECDVVVIGAGVAGLAAAVSLKRSGIDVICLEAAARIGGRVFTMHDPLAGLPIELGAEFVHGRPPEIWELIAGRNLRVFEHNTRALYFENGRQVHDREIGELADRLLGRMAKSHRKRDESFEQYLRRSRDSTEAQKWARVYVEGFNAARSEVVSVGALVHEGEAADRIDGDRTFRILDGYDSVPQALLGEIPGGGSTVRLNSVVKKVRWRPGRVSVEFVSALTGETTVARCRRLVITVSLGVLQADGIAFDPEPTHVLRAARSLRFGKVYRVTLRFREAFWEESEKFRRLGFLTSLEKRFRTWWTMHPIMTPMLTAWMAGSAADGFHPRDDGMVAREALASLGRILGRRIPTPEAYYFHDWQSDPFVRGAYSYVPVGAEGAREALARPESETLYFTGEAADVHGHGSTVHGAIAAGRRTAKLVAESLGG
jgi:monoamine oxidase